MSDFRASDPYLRKRYGISERQRPQWLVIAISLFLALIAWTIWSGANHSNPDIRYNLISFKPIDEKSIQIRFTVKFKSTEKSHICTLVARDYQANVVGQKNYPFAPGTTFQDVTTEIPTRVAAVNAGIVSCQVR